MQIAPNVNILVKIKLSYQCQQGATIICRPFQRANTGGLVHECHTWNTEYSYLGIIIYIEKTINIHNTKVSGYFKHAFSNLFKP